MRDRERKKKKKKRKRNLAATFPSALEGNVLTTFGQQILAHWHCENLTSYTWHRHVNNVMVSMLRLGSKHIGCARKDSLTELLAWLLALMLGCSDFPIVLFSVRDGTFLNSGPSWIDLFMDQHLFPSLSFSHRHLSRIPSPHIHRPYRMAVMLEMKSRSFWQNLTYLRGAWKRRWNRAFRTHNAASVYSWYYKAMCQSFRVPGGWALHWLATGQGTCITVVCSNLGPSLRRIN